MNSKGRISLTTNWQNAGKNQTESSCDGGRWRAVRFVMSRIILYISSANHPRLHNPCLFLSDAFFSVSLVLDQSQSVVERCKMLFTMQTLDINRQENYMVELTLPLEILSPSQSPGGLSSKYFYSPHQNIRLSCIVTEVCTCPPVCAGWLCMEEVETE